jgi:uncharacterized protein (TIGR03084 family)
MDAILVALAAQHAEFGGLLESLTDDDWGRPTRCEGWDVYDVVLHMAQTDEFAITAIGGGLEGLGGWAGQVDANAAAYVESQRGAASTELRNRWLAAGRSLRETLAAADPHLRVQWVTNKLSIHTLAATRLSECWIHSNDVAEAVGVDLAPTDRLEHIARLAWRTLPYAFDGAGKEMHGSVAFELEAPSSAHWSFVPDDEPSTLIAGTAIDLCNVAARRVVPSETALVASGPDAADVLALVRTYA